MRFTLLPLYLSVLLFFFAGSTFAAAAEYCYDCHDKARFSDKIIHKPVADMQCSICHDPHVARHENLLREREDVLCYSCHRKSKKQFSRGVIHPPVAEGNCSGCHAPHASSEKGLVNSALAKNCLSCHKELQQEFKITHKPFAEGKCGSCHEPHQADNLQLLSDKPDALCFSCHAEKTLRGSHRNYPLKLGGCLSCHNPHGSERDSLVRNFIHKPYGEGCSSCHKGSAPVEMATCLSCHEKTGLEMEANHSHITLQKGNSCLNCHSPHAGDDKDLLKASEKQICRSCHTETLRSYEAEKSRHPAVKKCSLCHEPHGSRKLAMLKGGGNEVCIQCHETQGNFTHPVGAGVLESHTGQMVTCVSCHNPMGTNYKYHLVQEGKRALCLLCHRTY